MKLCFEKCNFLPSFLYFLLEPALATDIRSLIFVSTFFQSTVSIDYYEAMRLMTTPQTFYEHNFNIPNEEEFKEKVIKSDKPVIVDFFSGICKASNVLDPRLKKIIHEKDGKILLGMVDFGMLLPLAKDYEVNSIPALLVFINGKPVERLYGVQDEHVLTMFVNKYI